MKHDVLQHKYPRGLGVNTAFDLRSALLVLESKNDGFGGSPLASLLADASDPSFFRCNITIDVNHLSEGLKLGLQEDREKNSEQLGTLVPFKVRTLQKCVTAYRLVHSRKIA